MKKRHKGRDRHHMIPKSRGGRGLPNNLLLIHIERHKCWHGMFGNLTLDEAIQLLKRLRRLKRRNR